jgi:hypothetical protein
MESGEFIHLKQCIPHAKCANKEDINKARKGNVFITILFLKIFSLGSKVHQINFDVHNIRQIQEKKLTAGIHAWIKIASDYFQI